MTIPLDMMDAVPSRHDAPVAHVGAVRQFLWSVRRELWENRWLYLAPACAALSFLIGFVINSAGLPEQMRAIASLDAIGQRDAITRQYVFVELLVMVAGAIISVVYCLDALYGERRDRSALLWKSMPVSDLVTVLAKASIPIVVQPLITFGVTVTTQLLMLLASTAILTATGHSAALIWTHVSPLSNAGGLLFHLVAIHGLSAAPLFAWLLMISAWAPRAPFVWAFVPPVVIVFLERMTFNTSYLVRMLEGRLTGGDTAQAGGKMLIDPMTSHTLAQFVGSGGLWIGFLITAAFLAAAVRLRRVGRAP